MNEYVVLGRQRCAPHQDEQDHSGDGSYPHPDAEQTDHEHPVHPACARDGLVKAREGAVAPLRKPMLGDPPSATRGRRWSGGQARRSCPGMATGRSSPDIAGQNQTVSIIRFYTIPTPNLSPMPGSPSAHASPCARYASGRYACQTVLLPRG